MFLLVSELVELRQKRNWDHRGNTPIKWLKNDIGIFIYFNENSA